MDPAGIREIMLVRPHVDNPYQLEAASEGLAYKTRFNQYFFNTPWIPLWPALPQRVSTASEGYPGWLQHDLAIFAGVDLEAGGERDVAHFRSAAERGLAVLLCGGQFGLGHGYRVWHDVEGALPAHVPVAKADDVDAKVRVAAAHPLLRGLPDAFGGITALHPIEPAADAAVLLAADDKPVLAVTERFGARQAILAVAGAEGMSCDALDASGFYGHPFYGDLMRQLMTWLMGVELPMHLSKVEPGGDASATSDGQVVHVGVAMPERAEGARLRCSMRAVDEGRLMAGGDTVTTQTVVEQTWPIDASTFEATIELADPAAGQCHGVYEVELAVEMDDPPNAPPPGSFGMSLPPQWTSWKHKAVDVRRFGVRFGDQRRSRVTVKDWTCAVSEGDRWSVRVAPPGAASVELDVVDGAGRAVGEAAVESDGGERELSWSVPALALGDYTARITVTLTTGDVERFEYGLKVVHVSDAEEEFHVAGHFREGRSSEVELAARIDGYLDGYGMDTLSIPVAGRGDALADESTPWHERTLRVRRLRYVDAMVTAHGRRLWADFDAYTVLLATHGTKEPYLPTEPCVHHPDYEAAVRERLTPLLALQRLRKGLISREIIDEPHLYPANVCRCAICQELYEQRYGEPIPIWDDLAGDQTTRRWRLFEWLEEYSARAFETMRGVKDELAPELHLHNVAVDRLFSSNFMFNGMHRWAKWGDEIYMACYPWSYLVWRGRHQAPHSQTHWIAAWIRGLARHYDIPWGVFMELWENDIPNRQMLPYWPVGQFYALLAEGVTRMNTFYISYGSEVFGISEERVREFGSEVGRIRPYFPLLAQTRRPRGRLAFMNPWCQWVMDPAPHRLPPNHEGYGYYRMSRGAPFDGQWPHENRRMLAYELMHRTIRDVEQVDEQLLCERTIDYQAIVITDCRFLMGRTMQQLGAYVEAGGVLVLDCDPARDETGARRDFVERLTQDGPTEQGVIVPGLGYERFTFGRGVVVRFTASLQTAYADALESGRAGIQEKIETAVGRLLGDAGLRPRWQVDRGDFDAAPRLGDGVCLVPITNLGEAQAAVEVTLRELPFEPRFAIDLTRAAPVELGPQGDGVSFVVSLRRYHGALVALLPDGPRTCGVVVGNRHVQAGGPLKYELAVEGASGPIRGAYLLDVTVIDPDGQAHRQLGGPVVVHNGTAMIERTLPVNGAGGTWTISVADAALGLAATTSFEVG
ncbi:MAG: hypothetical protein CMJ49_05860 [Planctomycetaceae bacterium]|nr:hypothetical protein [Planctomycetaceae bacterium]